MFVFHGLVFISSLVASITIRFASRFATGSAIAQTLVFRVVSGLVQPTRSDYLG